LIVKLLWWLQLSIMKPRRDTLLLISKS
jgi:hypothetical protein